MKIVKKQIIHNGTDVYVAHIDTEGADLGRVSPIPLDEIDFFIATYKKLHENNCELFDQLFKPANDFIKSLPEEAQVDLCNFFIDALCLINTSIDEGQDLANISNDIGYLFNIAVMKNDIPKLIFKWVDKNIQLPDLTNMVTEAHYTTEMTFLHNDYVGVTSISVLCKILCPIWGDLIYKTKKITDTAIKESLCYGVIAAVMACKEFSYIDQKVTSYIENIIRSEVSSKSYSQTQPIGFTVAVNGFSNERLNFTVYSIVFVKKFVIVNLLADTCNIMKFIKVCISSSLKALYSGLGKRNFKPRYEPTKTGDEEEGNVSLLENESHVTQTTADIKPLVRYGTEIAVETALKEFDIAPKLFNSILDYYAEYHIQPSPLNRCLTSLLFGDRIGGAAGIQFLNLRIYTKIVAATQIYIAKNWNNQLVDLLTATTAEEEKSGGSSNIDFRITMSQKDFGEYNRCTAIYPYTLNASGVNEKTGRYVTSKETRFDHVITGLKDFITTKHHYANTAPMVQELLGDEIRYERGDLIQYDEFVIRNIYQYILNVAGSEQIYV